MDFVFTFTSYRAYLQHMLTSSQQANPKYSLRAFSRKLGLTHAHLSLILRNKKNLSTESAAKVGRALGLKQRALEYFVLLAELELAQDPAVRAAMLSHLVYIHPDPSAELFASERFGNLSDWYHFAILEMTHTDGATLSAECVAKRLGIPQITADRAIKRLVRQGLLIARADGGYRKARRRVLVDSKTPLESLRRFHEQMMTKGIHSIREQSPAEKLIGSETVAIDPSLLKEVERITEDCFNRISLLASRSTNKTEVYHLGIQFFRLTKPTPEAANGEAQ